MTEQPMNAAVAALVALGEGEEKAARDAELAELRRRTEEVQRWYGETLAKVRRDLVLSVRALSVELAEFLDIPHASPESLAAEPWTTAVLSLPGCCQVCFNIRLTGGEWVVGREGESDPFVAPNPGFTNGTRRYPSLALAAAAARREHLNRTARG